MIRDKNNTEKVGLKSVVWIVRNLFDSFHHKQHW